MRRENVEDALLFLNFVKKVKEIEVKPDKNVVCSDGISFIYQEASAKKFVCVYCGTSYTYKKGLFSHMERLHNIIKHESSHTKF